MITQKYENSASFADLSGPYAYVVHTVNRFRLASDTVVHADSASEVLEHALKMGYVRVDVAPATPVNGVYAGEPVKAGDTATNYPV